MKLTGFLLIIVGIVGVFSSDSGVATLTAAFVAFFSGFGFFRVANQINSIRKTCKVAPSIPDSFDTSGKGYQDMVSVDDKNPLLSTQVSKQRVIECINEFVKEYESLEPFEPFIGSDDELITWLIYAFSSLGITSSNKHADVGIQNDAVIIKATKDIIESIKYDFLELV